MPNGWTAASITPRNFSFGANVFAGSTRPVVEGSTPTTLGEPVPEATLRSFAGAPDWINPAINSLATIAQQPQIDLLSRILGQSFQPTDGRAAAAQAQALAQQHAINMAARQRAATEWQLGRTQFGLSQLSPAFGFGGPEETQRINLLNQQMRLQQQLASPFSGVTSAWGAPPRMSGWGSPAGLTYF